jgi:hypothetical protein
MTPILGIIASSFRSAAGPDGAYDALATVTVGATAVTEVVFTGIPQGYKHLQLRAFFKTDTATWVPFKINGDTGSGRTAHFLRGNGTAASAGRGLASTGEGNYAVLSEPSQWGSAIVDLLDYSLTNKLKTARVLSGFDGNGSGNVVLSSILHVNNGTNAVASLGFDISQYTSGPKFVQYSQFTLYGVK